jgi:heat shock protein HslJ
LALLLILLIAGFALAACGDDQATDAGDDTTLPSNGTDDDDASSGGIMPSLAGNWVLERLEVDGREVTLPSGENGEAIAPTATIELGEIRGDSGCNSFGGRIDIGEDGSATITDLANTEMACLGEGLMDFEQVYLSTLRSVTGWEADPEGIALVTGNGRIDYRPGPTVEPAALFDTNWMLDSLYEGEGVERAVTSTDQSAPEAVLILSNAEAEISSPDCDPFTVAVTIEPGQQGTFSVDVEELATASTDCTNPNVASLVEGLGVSSSYLIDDQRLVFVGFEGETIGLKAAMTDN